MLDSIDFDSSFWKNKTALIDSRKLISPKQSIFFAFKGNVVNGHQYIPELYQKGLRHFIISEALDTKDFPDAQFIQTPNVIEVLQAFAKHHRQFFEIPVIGITGSNGKTILKEWLFLLLEQDYTIIKSPKSYNSQIGVPLSVLSIQKQHNLAIFEAGISQTGEMQQLEPIIQPNIGIFTNIGEAHNKGFLSKTQKILEKLLLFQNCSTLIYRIDHEQVHKQIFSSNLNFKTWSWGATKDANLPIYSQIKTGYTLLKIHYNKAIHQIKIPFTNQAAIENCLHGIATMLYLKVPISELEVRIKKLRDIPMRLELKEGINNCQIIDDSYNNDLEGVKIALDFLNQKHKTNPNYTKTIILSDISTHQGAKSYPIIAQLLQEYSIQKLIAIGDNFYKQQELFGFIKNTSFFKNTDDFINSIEIESHFYQETILLKGARKFEFERIAQQLKKRIHGTILEIDMAAVLNNLLVYKNLLKPSTKMMVMVKASAYGSGSYEIAQFLQHKQIDYLGVAYVDEGLELRKRGIKLPIMVMNCAPNEFEILCQHQLEPVIYSFGVLNKLIQFLEKRTNSKPYPIHLELDTGMHRLGFVLNDISNLIATLKTSKHLLQIKGIFSHLAASDEAEQEVFTLEQIAAFKSTAKKIEQHLAIPSIKHILNSAGISRYTKEQFDMVRLGIGLYGIDPNQKLSNLQNVVQLKTTIAQIKTLAKGDTIGYSRKGKINTPSRLAVLSIGYADGFLRAFGNGNAQVKIHNQMAPTIGNICMDMCFVDVSHIPDVREGDDVIIFDSIEMIEALANKTNSIPYEILTNISDRVPRIFYES